MATYTPDEIARGVRFAWAYHRKLRAYLRQPGGTPAWRGPAPDSPAFIHHVLAAKLADYLCI